MPIPTSYVPSFQYQDDGIIFDEELFYLIVSETIDYWFRKKVNVSYILKEMSTTLILFKTLTERK